MAFKYIPLIALISLAGISALPYYSHDDGGHSSSGGYGGHGSGGSSHQSVHIVSHGGGGDDGGHGHGGHGDDGHDYGKHDDGSSGGHVEYTFSYGVKNDKTADHKEHSEKREGHKVTGHYEVLEADGHKRTVYYTADKHKGFQAVVQRELVHHFVPAQGGQGHSFKGGKAQLDQSSSAVGGGHGGGYGGHDGGYGGHDSGHGKGPQSSSYSLTQEHAVAVHGGGKDDGYGAESYGYDKH